MMDGRAIASARRVRGLLLALVLGVSQATAWLHAAVISHGTCLEHGEAIHAGVETAAPDAGPVAAAEASDADRAAAEVTLAAAHDHCASSALLRWRDIALAAPAVTAALPPVVRHGVPAVPSHRAAARAAVYLVAPKTSPPHADA
jgi:hypothetical protein